MARTLRGIVTMAAILVGHLAVTAPREAAKRPKVILVSMDGFRHDYLSKTSVPNFNQLIESGVTMPYINNTFVTLTFPSHFTIATGRYAESHGIVGNHMYDSEFDNYFTYTTVESRWWSGAEPVWITIKKAGLKAGIYFWPGSEAEIQGIRPDRYEPYNGSVPYEERVQSLLQWMSADNFDLGLLYFDEPDHTGHTYGPNGTETFKMVERMDDILGLILKGIEDNGLKESVNLIVTSDHGMASVDTLTKLIDLSDYVNSSLLLQVIEQGPTTQIRPLPGKDKELVDALAKVPHMTAMLKENIPERYHYREHRRSPLVLATAEEGWQITDNATRRKTYPFLGDHGYDNDFLSMKPIFIASGPAFKSGAVVEPIRSVDIYPLICHLLGVQPAPNNGSLTRAKTLLKEAPIGSQNDGTPPTSSWFSLCVISLAIVRYL